MKTHLTLAAALAVGATGAYAGGMDRSGQSIAPIFEDGSYVELSFGSVSPTVSGTIGAGTVPSNDMAKSYLQLGAAYKRDLNDKLSMAVIFDQPYGADVDYGAASGSYPFVGSTATVDTNAVTGILRYKLSDRFAVHGGVRILQSSGEVAIPFYSYTMSTSTETDASYLIGASYEIPDIALRAALTYHSETDITFDTTENGSASGNMVVTMPQTVNLDFQTGIAADTLLMASVRWAEWSATDISPNGFALATSGGSLVDYENDTYSYSIGIGRRFSEKLSGSATIGYERTIGTPVGNLGPTDGYTSIGLGMKYQVTEETAISGGLRYVWVGDATTSTIGGDFSDNKAIGIGFKISHTF
ncbi:OmpP1/FadL family transporter [Celeribacter sp.]|uniref:OmpP1/FadL family transporter n=1 Tax=Celeribacter sp. TaxID=1890673 RepID=UPI003A9393B4